VGSVTLVTSTPHTGKDGRYIYTHDLLRLDRKSRGGSTAGIDSCLGGVSTLLQLNAWKHHLCHHLDQDFTLYILQGIQFSFHIGTDPPGSLNSVTKNKITPQSLMATSRKKLILRMSTACSPQQLPQLSTSIVLGLSPRSTNQCLITDLSFQEDASVNDAIELALCSLKYITVEQVAKKAVLLGKGSLMAKIDIKSAYRLIPVSPADQHYLGMLWKGISMLMPSYHFVLDPLPKSSTP